MNIKPYFLAAAIGLASIGMVGCSKPAMSTEHTTNPNIPYEVLFERHGYEVGRFEDGGRAVYVVIPKDGEGPASAQYYYTTSSGKSATTHRVESATYTPRAAEMPAPPPAP
jgi:hypothetical protein